MDFVYILKENEKNDDLKYSLRSIAKFYPENKVWIVGYKPSWVKNVNYLPVKQTRDKWKNSITNIIAACECKDISEDFILMNDDFFMIEPNVPIEIISNANLGLLSKTIIKYRTMRSPWFDAFSQVRDLLKRIGVSEPYYDYEAHLPLQINKEKFLEVMALPEVVNFMQTSRVLHKRTLYKNYYKTERHLELPADVKVTRLKDDSIGKLKICGWLSVYDKQVGNSSFYNLNTILKTNFPNKCIYERDITPEEKENLKNIQIDKINIKVLDHYKEPPRKKKDFLHF